MTEHVHLTPKIFKARKRGEISEAQLYRLVAEAAYACDGCHDNLQPWRRSYHHPTPAQPNLDDVFQLITYPTRKERKAAKRDFRTLLKLPAEQRTRKIRRAFKRYRSPILAELLLEACMERLPVDARDAYHLAELAQTVLHQCTASARVDELRALCFAHLAAASKAQGDLESPEEQFRAARHLLNDLPAPHPAVQAVVARLEGSYRKERRQLQRSERLLRQALSLCELLDDSLQIARTRLVLGITQFHAGAIDQAIATTNSALDAFNSRRHRRLFLMGRHNLTLYLTESDQPEAGAIRLKADLGFYREASSSHWPNADLYFHWLAGKIQRGLGNFTQAKDHLSRARDGFADRGTRYECDLISQDLGLVYAARRRP